jgi:hypothetical protein
LKEVLEAMNVIDEYDYGGSWSATGMNVPTDILILSEIVEWQCNSHDALSVAKQLEVVSIDSTVPTDNQKLPVESLIDLEGIRRRYIALANFLLIP